MPHKGLLYLLVFGIIMLGNIEDSNAQFLKKLKDKVSKTVTQTVGEISSKKNKTNKLQQPNSQKSDKETHQSSANNNKPIKQQTQEIDYSDFFIYKSPSKYFRDVHVQKYKGLPRFGACNFYMKNNISPILSSELSKKRDLLGKGYIGFRKLVQINMMKGYFNFLDKESLTPRTENRTYTEKEEKSFITQKLITEFAFNLTTDEIKRTYFCEDPAQKKCANFVKWGGYRSDDFTENEKYVDFVKNYLTELSAWSSHFFKGGTKILYLTHKVKFNGNGYDFDNNGYWVQIPLRNKFFGLDYSSTADQYFFTYSPKTPYGQNLSNKISQVKYINGEVLFKISPEKAEALVNKKLFDLHLVSRVKVVFKEIETTNPYSPQIQYTYHFESPIIEIYEDASLAEKMGEISLKNLIYKADKI